MYSLFKKISLLINKFYITFVQCSVVKIKKILNCWYLYEKSSISFFKILRLIKKLRTPLPGGSSLCEGMGEGYCTQPYPYICKRGCFRIRTHDQQVTKAQLYHCTRARPQDPEINNIVFKISCR